MDIWFAFMFGFVHSMHMWRDVLLDLDVWLLVTAFIASCLAICSMYWSPAYLMIARKTVSMLVLYFVVPGLLVAI